MPVAVNMPERKDPLETISRLLGIASSVYGIKSDIEQSKVRDIQMKQAEANQARSERIGAGKFTNQEIAEGMVKILPADTSDPDALPGELGETDQKGNWVTKRPIKFMTKEMLENRKNNLAIDKMVAETDMRNNAVYMPEAASKYFEFAKPDDPDAFQINIRYPTNVGIEDKPTWVTFKKTAKGTGDNQRLQQQQRQWVQSQENQFADKFEKESLPVKQELEEIEVDQSLIDDAKSGKISWGQVEGLLATKIAGRLQKGVLTDKDFVRGSLTPTDLVGKTKYQIESWYGTQTDKARALEGLLQLNRRNAQRRYNEKLNRQKNRVEEWNLRNGDVGNIKWETVSPTSGQINSAPAKSKNEDAADAIIGG